MKFSEGRCIPFRYGTSTYSIYYYKGDPVINTPVRYCVGTADEHGIDRIVVIFPYGGERSRLIIEAAKEALGIGKVDHGTERDDSRRVEGS